MNNMLGTKHTSNNVIRDTDVIMEIITLDNVTKKSEITKLLDKQPWECSALNKSNIQLLMTSLIKTEPIIFQRLKSY